MKLGGSATRRLLSEQRSKYARVFSVSLDLVEDEMWEDGEGKVWCPSRPDFPVWTLNQSEAEYQGRAEQRLLGPRAQRRAAEKRRR